ncbi:MAG: heparan-alpha-glucosaminide N-acetyltransferase [Thermoplasmata archaeon]|nr:heparan-alpha-glucosaminide N-acetyltransferase [Thermoplasmata archaeon]
MSETLQTKRQRVWEIDALRGVLIFCVLCTHLYYTVDAFCIDGYYNIDSYAYVDATDPLHFWFDWGADGVIYKAFMTQRLRSLCVRAGVDVFFVVSGISCLFSRNNLRRGLKMLAGAFLISAFTKLLAIWTGDPTQFIRFGVLHCYAYCHLIYYFLLEKRSDKTLLAVAAPVLAVGYYLRYHSVFSDFALLYPFGVHENGAAGRDYWPIFPMLGWMLLGVVLGRRLYGERRSRFPGSPGARWTRPLQALGRCSGVIYVVHIVAYTAFFCGIGWLFQLY